MSRGEAKNYNRKKENSTQQKHKIKLGVKINPREIMPSIHKNE
jgi:hypothetical protein